MRSDLRLFPPFAVHLRRRHPFSRRHPCLEVRIVPRRHRRTRTNSARSQAHPLHRQLRVRSYLRRTRRRRPRFYRAQSYQRGYPIVESGGAARLHAHHRAWEGHCRALRRSAPGHASGQHPQVSLSSSSGPLDSQLRDRPRTGRYVDLQEPGPKGWAMCMIANAISSTSCRTCTALEVLSLDILLPRAAFRSVARGADGQASRRTRSASAEGRQGRASPNGVVRGV
ncbi:hypothetical protein C8Q80DRAFT_310067 [Daedaleopsis nitida]|nr:hypothetical protein C8Q80DRAFT_310067 [Daedaleopsis nitida]